MLINNNKIFNQTREMPFSYQTVCDIVNIILKKLLKNER